jgi:hypothetical protein
MLPTRLILLLCLIVFCAGPALAQRPGPEFWRKVGCEPFEPRTKLEAIDERHSSVIVKAFTQITTIEVNGVRIDALEMRELGNVARAKGIVIVLREGESARQDGGSRPRENRAFVDYEEIDALINAIDAIARVDETMTRLPGFEARYKTLGDLEIGVFRQTRRGTAAVMSTGICDRASQLLTLDELAKVKAMIQEAKMRLDELR